MLALQRRVLVDDARNTSSEAPRTEAPQSSHRAAEARVGTMYRSHSSTRGHDVEDTQRVIYWYVHRGHPDFTRHGLHGPVYRHDGRSRFVYGADDHPACEPVFELIGEFVFCYGDSEASFVIRGDRVFAATTDDPDGAEETPWYLLRGGQRLDAHRLERLTRDDWN